MALRKDGLRTWERDGLVKALKGGKSWEQAKAQLPDVDPKMLDSNFKEYCHEAAGVELKAPKAPKANEPSEEADELDGQGEQPPAASPELEPKPEEKPKQRRGRK